MCSRCETSKSCSAVAFCHKKPRLTTCKYQAQNRAANQPKPGQNESKTMSLELRAAIRCYLNASDLGLRTAETYLERAYRLALIERGAA
jgi:hypothetical protein